MLQSKTTKAIIKERTLLLLDAIVAAILIESSRYILQLFGVESIDIIGNFLLLAILLLLIVSSFLVLFIYKFHVVNKALLEINPDFYEQREFNKWFDYYAK